MSWIRGNLSSIMFVVALPVVLLVSVSATPQGKKAKEIGVTSILLTVVDHQTSATRIRAFIPTDSLSTTCLVSLAEANQGVVGTTVFCAPRTFEGEDGINVHIFLPESPPSSAFWVLAVFQENAKRYGDPVIFFEP